MARGGITTRSGDFGETTQSPGTRGPKSSPVFQLLGAIDELSCSLGLYRTFLPSTAKKRNDFLREIQMELVALSGIITGFNGPNNRQTTALTLQHIDDWTTHMENVAPPEILQDWSIPGDNSRESAFAHQARASTRHAERELVAYTAHAPHLTPCIPLFNRLSDLMWWMACIDPALD